LLVHLLLLLLLLLLVGSIFLFLQNFTQMRKLKMKRKNPPNFKIFNWKTFTTFTFWIWFSNNFCLLFYKGLRMWFHWMQDLSLDGHNWHIVKKWKKKKKQKKNIDGSVLLKHAKTLALQMTMSLKLWDFKYIFYLLWSLETTSLFLLKQFLAFVKRTSNCINHEEIKHSKLNIHLYVPNLFDDHAYDKPIGQVWHVLSLCSLTCCQKIIRFCNSNCGCWFV
jgi:hypothetical protein